MINGTIMRGKPSNRPKGHRRSGIILEAEKEKRQGEREEDRTKGGESSTQDSRSRSQRRNQARNQNREKTQQDTRGTRRGGKWPEEKETHSNTPRWVRNG